MCKVSAKHMRTILLFFLTVALGLTPVNAASSNKKAAIKHKSKSQQISFSTNAFDLSVERLPANYIGNDLIDIYQKMQLPREKGEFEKTEEFESRIAFWKTKPILGSIRPGDLLAFELSEGIAPDVLSIKYNADEEQITATINIVPQFFHSDSQGWLGIFYTSKQIGSRIGTTGMGVKKRVKSFVASNIGLCMPEPTDFSIILSKSMPRDEVLRIKPRLRVLAIVSIVSPYKVDYTETSEASLSDPREWLVYYRGFYVDLKSIWLIDYVSGEIIMKKDGPFDRHNSLPKWLKSERLKIERTRSTK